MDIKLLLIALLSTPIGISAQDVLNVSDGTTAITSSQAGDYDHIDLMWQMEAKKTYLIALPANLDGYYFGPNAVREKVSSYEKQADGSYIVTSVVMNDTADFNTGELYLVTPTIDIDSITIVVPGLKTNVAATAEGKELVHVGQDKIVTGIDDILDDKTNGISVIYDTSGRKVSSVRKGETYVIDGKKVIIK